MSDEQIPRLFDPDAESKARVAEQVARMAEANRMPGHDVPSLDPELQARRVDVLENAAGFTVRMAEQAAEQIDPTNIPSEGTKRKRELRAQARKPKTGRAKVDEIARLSNRQKAARDRGLAPPNESKTVPRIKPGDLQPTAPKADIPQKPVISDSRRLLAFELERDDPEFPPPAA